MSKLRILVTTLLALVLALPCAACAGNPSVLDGVDAYLRDRGKIGAEEPLSAATWYRPGDNLTDWNFILELRMGMAPDETYLNDLRSYVEDAYASSTPLGNAMPTEWHRICLAVLASGADPSSFGTDDSGKPINLVADGTYGWSHPDGLAYQGSNAYAYALMVLKGGGYSCPDDARYSERSLVEGLLGYQDVSGGFRLSTGGSPDVDITAMALQALAFFADDQTAYRLPDGVETTVPDAITRALDYLSEAQRKGGYFAFSDTYSSDTTSQVILALCALGVDPARDERFLKNGKSAVDALLTFRNEDGGFASTLGSGGVPDESDTMATRQAGCALAAVDMLNTTGKGKFFDFSNASAGAAKAA